MGGDGSSKGDGSSESDALGAPRDGACCRYAQLGACCCCLPVFGWCYLYSKATFVKSNEIALAESTYDGRVFALPEVCGIVLVYYVCKPSFRNTTRPTTGARRTHARGVGARDFTFTLSAESIIQAENTSLRPHARRRPGWPRARQRNLRAPRPCRVHGRPRRRAVFALYLSSRKGFNLV